MPPGKHAVKGYVDSRRVEMIGDGLPISVPLIWLSGMDTRVGEHAAPARDGPKRSAAQA